MLRAATAVRDYEGWRKAARRLLRDRIPPEQAIWSEADEAQDHLFAPEDDPRSVESAGTVMIPRTFLNLARAVAMHSDASRWDRLYTAAWRLTNGERHLLEIETDDDIAALQAMRRSVEKDIYRMRAFVRFRKVESEEGERFVAWYRPEHHTLDANGPFFVERFGSMRWAILTPETSLFWDLQALRQGPGVPRSGAPQDDELEDLWRLYYRTIYNPARLNLDAMRAQLPVRRWIDLPESRTIHELVRQSRGRVQHMADAQPPSAADFIPQAASLPVLREAVHTCRACELCARATQPVWGEGAPHASIVLVGEQPGDEEDLRGRPFVGPAGRVLDEAMAEAGLDRAETYVTNAVKAFRFEQRGKRRIHQTPRPADIAACRPWLAAEIGVVRPRAILCLGASAAHSVLGRKIGIAAERGKWMDHPAARVAVTYHPSAVLRVPEERAKRELFANLVSDLKLIKSAA